MLAKKITCEVTQIVWLTPTVFSLKFKTSKKLKFFPGQFLSIYVPDNRISKTVRRAYSFANSPEMAKREGFELCIKHVPGGAGSEYMAALRPGDTFEATAPYGHFLYAPPKQGRYVCFISTSTGIAPFRSMVLSEEFLSHQPERCFFIFGARSESEFLYKNDLEIYKILCKNWTRF
jgi:ferredoxin-NADP reductase